MRFSDALASSDAEERLEILADFWLRGIYRVSRGSDIYSLSQLLFD